jgi:hypothetical protein
MNLDVLELHYVMYPHIQVTDRLVMTICQQRNKEIDMSEDTEPDKPKRKISNAELDNVKNYLAIEISYGTSLLMPYKEGIAFMASLENAEKVTMPSYGQPNIKFNTERFELKTEIVTQAFYREQKMNHLLGVDNE